MKTASLPDSGFTTTIPEKSNVRWFVCFLLFAATTINYMDRSVFSLIEPLLHLPFMGWIPGLDAAHQPAYDINFGRVLICFQIAYGVGFLFAGRLIDKLGTKTGYAIAVLVWGMASLSHSLVTTVLGFCIARIFLGLGESGNFPAAIKATTEWFPSEERALATGLFNSGSNASAFIAPILIAVVTARFGWHAAFLCTGSMGMIWLVVWLLFPYNRLRRGATQTQATLAPVTEGGSLYSILFRHRGFWAFFIAKGLTDPIWWFYLFYLPKFLNDNYGLNLSHVKYPLFVIYTAASIGSISGGWLSGFLMNRGFSINAGRKTALLVCALCVMPIMSRAAHAHALSQQRMACNCSLLPRHRRTSGLVCEPLLHPNRHVPLHRHLYHRRPRWSSRSSRRGRFHMARLTLFLSPSSAHLHPRRLRLCCGASHLSDTRPASWSTP